MTPSPYPEHDKLEAVSERSQIIGEFLEFVAGEYGWHLCEWGMLWDDRLHWPRVGLRNVIFNSDLDPDPLVHGPPESRRHDIREEYMQVSGPITVRLARYFEIDLAVLEEEKQTMLAAMRRLNDAEG